MSDTGQSSNGAEQVRFSLKKPCDWSRGERPRCNQTPTAHVGDIYYACEGHYDEFAEWVDRVDRETDRSKGGDGR
jgi:hypothetical protein